MAKVKVDSRIIITFDVPDGMLSTHKARYGDAFKGLLVDQLRQQVRRHPELVHAGWTEIIKQEVSKCVH